MAGTTPSIHAGSSAYVSYGYESVFGGGGAKTLLFGKEQKANSLEFQNSQQPLGQLYEVEIQDYLYKKNFGGVTMEYILSNPWIFASILNDPEFEDLTPNKHTFHSDPDNADVVTSTRNVASLNLEIYENGQTAGITRNAKGVICPSMNIKTSIDAPVSISQQLTWGIEDAVSTMIGSVPSEVFTPYSFVHGSVELPDSGGTIANVQELDITLNTGAELVYGIDNTPNAVGAFRKLLNMTGKLTIALIDKTNIDRVQARTEVADMRIVFSNGLADDNEKSIDMLFTGIGLSRHGSQGVAPGELLTEIVDFQCRTLVVEARNDSPEQTTQW